MEMMGYLLHQVFPHVDHLIAGHDGAALGQVILAVFLVEPVGDSGVHGDHEVLAGLVAGLLDTGDQSLEGVLVAGQVGRVAALVAHAGGRHDLLQGMEDLGAHAQRFLEVGSADGHDHELLDVDGVGGVSAAVEDVHHRHGQGLGIDAADIVVQAHAGSGSAGLGAGQGHAQDGVGAQTGLVGGAVELDEQLVDAGLIQHVQAQDGLGDLAVDILDRLLHALAAVTGLVAVAQLAGLMDTGGSAGGNGRAADGAVVQRDLDLDGGVAAGVQNLSGHHIYDFKVLFHV